MLRIIKNFTLWTFKSAGVYLHGEPEVMDLLAGEEWRNLRGGVFVFVLFDSCVVTSRPRRESRDGPKMEGARR